MATIQRYCRLLVVLGVVGLVLFREVDAQFNSTRSPREYRTAFQRLNSSTLESVYIMTVFFLEDILQQSILSDVDPTWTASIGAFEDSWSEHWDEWLIYLIGFAVCTAIGIVMCGAMLVAAPVVCCTRTCKCCYRKKKPQKAYSRCSCVGCMVTMVTVTAALLLGVIALFGVNDKLYRQLSEETLNDVQNSIRLVDQYLKSSVSDINVVAYDGYVQVEEEVFSTLDSIPTDITKVFDDITSVERTVQQLSTFTENMESLKSNLSSAHDLAGQLDHNTTRLAEDLEVFRENATIALSGCSSTECNQTLEAVASLIVLANFSNINFTSAILAIQFAEDMQLNEIVANLSLSLRNIENSVNESISEPVSNAKAESTHAKTEIENIITDANQTVYDADILGIADKLSDPEVRDIWNLVAEIVYYVVMALIIVMTVIVACNFIGILWGFIGKYQVAPDPNSSKKKKSGSCCSKSCGSPWFIASNVFAFIFYWVYMLIVVVCFVAAGLIHTEVCRHVVDYETPASNQVLPIFDRWINESFANSIDSFTNELLVFQTYKDCQQDEAIVTALGLEDSWNISTITEQIRDALDTMKGTNFTVPQVNLSTPNLHLVLMTLDAEFGVNGVNFTRIYDGVDPPVVGSNLTAVADMLKVALNDSGLTDLLVNINTNQVIPAETGRELLLVRLRHSEAVLDGVSFSNISATINRSQEVINSNGTEIVHAYVNATADTIYRQLSGFADNTMYSLEHDVAMCGTLYDSVTILVDIFCVEVLYPINGFWFSLGWCLFFLIPSIIVAFHLVEVYRGPRKSKSKKSKGAKYVEQQPLVGPQSVRSPDGDWIGPGRDNQAFQGNTAALVAMSGIMADDTPPPDYEDNIYYVPMPGMTAPGSKPVFQTPSGASNPAGYPLYPAKTSYAGPPSKTVTYPEQSSNFTGNAKKMSYPAPDYDGSMII